jgi:hypothetical protein
MLVLKVGASVMLMKNMTNRLVNGLIGKVVALSQNSATVYFKQLEVTETFCQELFTRYIQTYIHTQNNTDLM